MTIGAFSSLARLASLSAVVLALAGSGTFAQSTHEQSPSSAGAAGASSTGKSTLSSPIFAGPTDVCLSTDEAADIDTKIVVLERDLKVAKAKARKLGGVLGCGVGVGWQIDKGATTVDSVPFCGVVFGWRF